MQSYNIFLIGDAGVGKSTFLTRHKTGEFTRQYNRTERTTVTILTYNTTHGAIQLNLIENPDWLNSYPDGVIVMFDITSKNTYTRVSHWIEMAQTLYGVLTPIVLCGNKVDIKERKVKPAMITAHRTYNCQYYDISAKSNYNYEKPFLHLLRRILRDENLAFTEREVVVPPTVQQTEN